MIYLWVAISVAGFVLGVWAGISLPKGTDMMPGPIRGKVTTDGPYRFLKHPMYIGNVMIVAGLAGMNGGRWGGIFAALAVGFVAEMLMRQWAGLEKR